MIIDKLYEEVEKFGHVCIGLDTSIDYLTSELKQKYDKEEALFVFNKRIIDATCDIAACYKVQIAYYEALGMAGLMAYKTTLKYLREKNKIIIGDVKRGDIAQTAKMYALAHFEGDFEVDFITLNAYMGLDSIEAYSDYIKNKNKGVFVLIRTSNKGAHDIQYLETKEGRKVYSIMGEKVQAFGKNFLGNCNYSSVGGVVGCTHKEEGEALRKELDSTFFLIPGYGAQGGKAEDVKVYLKQKNGGIVNASRSILLAYKNNIENNEKEFELYSRQEAIKMRDEIQKSV